MLPILNCVVSFERIKRCLSFIVMSQRPEENYGPPSPRNSFALNGPDPSRSLNTIGQVRDGFLSESDMAGPDEVRNYPD